MSGASVSPRIDSLRSGTWARIDPAIVPERVPEALLSLLAQRDASLMDGVLANQSNVVKLLAPTGKRRRQQPALLK